LILTIILIFRFSAQQNQLPGM